MTDTKHNQLIHKETKFYEEDSKKRMMDIKIELWWPIENTDDYFSVTWYIYKGETRTDKYNIKWWAIGKEIVDRYKEFAIFNELHLCDSYGIPMHFISNIIYHLKENRDRITSIYNIKEEEAEILEYYTENREILEYKLVYLWIIDRYRKKAIQAIEKLERLTGEKYTHRSEEYYTEEKEKDIIEKGEKALEKVRLYDCLDEKKVAFIEWYSEEEREEIDEDFVDECIKLLDDWDYSIMDNDEANDVRVERIENLYEDIGGELLQNHWRMSCSIDEDGDVVVSLSTCHSDRGEDLSGYDWVEHETQHNGTKYYIYRNN